MASQTEKGKGKEQATWDTAVTKIFVDLCVQEVRNNNREGGHFSRIGWKNIVHKFNEATGRGYDKKQLKNRLDTLRRDWVLWEALVGKETGLGWDPVRKNIDADNAWWDRKLKENTKWAKFRICGLENVFELDEIFRDVVANGDRAWAPTSGSLPPLYEKSTLGEDNVDIDNDSDPDNDNLQNSTPLDSISIGVGHNRDQNREKKRRKATVSSKLSKQLDRLCDVVEGRSSSITSNRKDLPGCSIMEVIEYMATIPECPKRSPLFMVGAKLFKKRENREMFVALGDDETRVAWLKDEQQDMMHNLI